MPEDTLKGSKLQFNIPEAIKALSVESIFPKITPLPEPLISLPVSKTNPAKWAYTRLKEYILDFEAGLDEDHEVGARLVSFGQTLIFHIQNIGYYGPDIITFDGINDKGEKVQLIQHISQLSVILMALKRLDEKPRRIGFNLEKNDQTETT